MSEISSERKVSALVEAQTLIRSLAEPTPEGVKFKVAIRKIKRALPQLSNNRIRDVWNADKRICISADELNELRAAKANEKAATNELAELRERLSRLERLLVQTNTNLDRPEIDRSWIQDGGRGGSHRTVDSR